MINLNNISVSYDNTHYALSYIDLHIHAGELVVLSGPSGSGKTSLLNLLFGLIKPTEGSVVINKKNLSHLDQPSLAFLRRDMGRVFQTPQLLSQETVFTNASLPLVVANYPPDEIKRRTNAALSKTSLLDKSLCRADSLSAGEQKLLEVARAIVSTPKVLLLDEPTANVDANTAQLMLSLFQAFNKIGVTIILATHHTNPFSNTHSRHIYLKEGKLQKGAWLYARKKETA